MLWRDFRENQKCYAIVGTVPSSRNGRREQSYSNEATVRQENSRPQEKIFFLTAFMELSGVRRHTERKAGREKANWYYDCRKWLSHLCR
jgi:hypothetical protein